MFFHCHQGSVATALTVYGIETRNIFFSFTKIRFVATALTVYGIETLGAVSAIFHGYIQLQQHLPFTVLKLVVNALSALRLPVATALTVYGIETYIIFRSMIIII